MTKWETLAIVLELSVIAVLLLSLGFTLYASGWLHWLLNPPPAVMIFDCAINDDYCWYRAHATQTAAAGWPWRYPRTAETPPPKPMWEYFTVTPSP